MATYSFAEMLQISKTLRQGVDDADTIRSMMPGCIDIRPGDMEEDKRGIDYVVTLRSGATINIDVKLRTRGSSRFWNGEPEFALEDWSVVNENGNRGKAGWTLDESKLTDYIWFAFDPSDSLDCYLVPFQLLRVAAINNWRTWQKLYKNDTQKSNGGSWKSHCVFVPASVVFEAIDQAMRSQLRLVEP